MIGIPVRAMVLAAGSGAGETCDNMSEVRPMIPPVMREAGMMTLCDDVPNIHLAICGAVMPTKPSGPQKAVTAPVMMQQLSRADSLISDTFAPAICANSSPNRTMSRPLHPMQAIAVPAVSAPPMMRMSVQVVVVKLPADQL